MKHVALQVFELQMLSLHTWELLYRLIWLNLPWGGVWHAGG
jgi:hypothetical protein